MSFIRQIQIFRSNFHAKNIFNNLYKFHEELFYTNLLRQSNKDNCDCSSKKPTAKKVDKPSDPCGSVPCCPEKVAKANPCISGSKDKSKEAKAAEPTHKCVCRLKGGNGYMKPEEFGANTKSDYNICAILMRNK